MQVPTGVKKCPRGLERGLLAHVGRFFAMAFTRLRKAGSPRLAPVGVTPAAIRGRGQRHAPTRLFVGGTNLVRHLLREEVGLGARVTRCAQGPVVSGYLGHVLQVLVHDHDTLDHGRQSHGADLPGVIDPDLEELVG
jgi:hypothetical protein